jgi:hypothetical protein
MLHGSPERADEVVQVYRNALPMFRSVQRRVLEV